jgi:hypothetical protein
VTTAPPKVCEVEAIERGRSIGVKKKERGRRKGQCHKNEAGEVDLEGWDEY